MTASPDAQRRRLLRWHAASLAVLFAAAVVPPGCGDADAEVVVGEGPHTFVWDANWAQLPPGVELGYTHGRIVVDSSGRVYVATNGAASVCVFAPDGSFLRAFGDELQGGIHGMALAGGERGERLYLAHALRGEVLEVSLEGEVLDVIGWPEQSGLYPEASRYRPTSVAVAPDGSLYVADGYGLSFVHRYDAQHRYLGSFGGRGRGPDELRNPHGLWIDEAPDGETVLYVCDRENSRVQVLDLEGGLLETWSEGLRRPCFLHRRGDVFALADIDGRVTLLDRSGAVLAHLGDNPDPAGRDRRDVPPDEQVPGVFVSPHGVYWGADGSLFVVEWLDRGRITRLIPRS